MSKQTIVSIFVAQYANIDPNIPQPYNDLDDKLVLIPDDCADNNDAAQLFGVPLDVVMHDFLYDDIQRDYVFYRKPSFVGVSCSGHMFYDGICSRVIDPAKIDTYMKKWLEQCVVYKKEQEWQVKNKNDIVLYLCESFMDEKGFVPRNGEIHLLSASQIQEIDKRQSNLNLFSFYNEEIPNIFVSIHTSH